MQYTDFSWNAMPRIDAQTWQLQVRSANSAANLYTRVTGVAHFPLDPAWEDLGWQRGTLNINITLPPSVVQPMDVLIESCATAGFRQLTRDEKPPATIGSDDFGIALDAVVDVALAGRALTLTLFAAYMGDIWVPDVSFTADLLLYRQTLDNQA